MGVGRGGRKVTEKGSVQEGIGRWPGRGGIWKWAGLRRGGKGEDVVWEKNFLKTKLSSEAGDAALQRRDAVGLASPCLAPRALCLSPRPGAVSLTDTRRPGIAPSLQTGSLLCLGSHDPCSYWFRPLGGSPSNQADWWQRWAVSTNGRAASEAGGRAFSGYGSGPA